MKIFYVITKGDTIGGAQRHVIDLLEEMIEFGFDIILAYGGETGVIEEMISDREVKCYRIPTLSNAISLRLNYAALKDLRNLVNIELPDIIHLHSTKSGLLFRLLKLYNDVPIVYTVHGWGFVKGTGLLKSAAIYLLERVTRRLISHYILVSKHDLDLGMKRGILEDYSSSLIYNGVEDAYNQTLVKRNRSKRLKLLMVARFSKQKDQLTLFEAIKELPVDLYYLGDGPTRRKVEAHIAKYSDKKANIYFEGHIVDVNSYFYESDVFLLISNWEGFPISTIEAMSMSLPIVVSDVGGSAEVFSDNKKFGYTVPQGDVSYLRRVILELIETKSSLNELGYEARKVYLSEFTLNKMASKTKTVYSQVIAE